jgi:hypothetical protein
MPLYFSFFAYFALLANGDGAVMHVGFGWTSLPCLHCHVSAFPCVHVCVSFVHVRSWPRIRSLYALYMLLANPACVLQVVGLTCGRLVAL